MLRRRMMLALVATAVIGGCWLAQAVSQDGAERQPRRGGRRMNMEEFRKRMQERIRDSLGSSEEEWKVLGPKIEKVQQIQRQSRGGFRGGRMGGRRGGRRGGEATGGATAPQREQSEVEKKTAALRALLQDEASGPQAIKAALAALRKAREKAQLELAAARKELRVIVTVRQEAQLVLMNVLD